MWIYRCVFVCDHENTKTWGGFYWWYDLHHKLTHFSVSLDCCCCSCYCFFLPSKNRLCSVQSNKSHFVLQCSWLFGNIIWHALTLFWYSNIVLSLAILSAPFALLLKYFEMNACKIEMLQRIYWVSTAFCIEHNGQLIFNERIELATCYSAIYRCISF